MSSGMSSEAARFARVAATFDEVIAGVTDWDAPTPCAGWTARDVVGHLVGWVPGMFESVGVTVTERDDLVVRWASLRDGLAVVLEDPEASARTVTFGPAGEHTVPAAVDRFVTPDVLVHTWDLARASGREVALDEEVVAGTLAGFEAMGEMLVQSGHFAAPAPVVADASVQDRLVAASGRDPRWHP